jgi:F-type H+-transporting ATPase subunit alpha
VNNGYVDDVDTKNLLAFEAGLRGFMKSKYAEVMNKIEASKDLDADAEKQLAAGIEEYKKTATL